LADKVFADPEERRLLNQVLHPRIREEMERRTREIGQKDPEAIVVIDAALLVELGDHQGMDRVIVVTSTERQQIQRLKDRDGADQEEARKILSSQMAPEEKLKVADFVIRNEGSLNEVRRRAKEVFQELKRIAVQKKDQPKLQRPSK
jgi:dephospho-CoA kinase